MNNWKRYIRAGNFRTSLDETLRAPISALHGISAEAAEVLGAPELRIRSIFDLATSRFFNAAKTVVEQSRDSTSFLVRDNVTTTSLFDPSYESGEGAIQLESIVVLNGIGPAIASKFENTLAISNLHSMAFWFPFRASLEMLEAKRLGDRRHIDSGVPPELVPQYNYYATEQTHFRTFSMGAAAGRLNQIQRQNIVDTPIHFATSCSDNVDQQPKVGAVLHFEQSWLPTGLTLGGMQYGLGLAPGESTRIAIIDWARSDAASSEEKVEETSSLTNELQHNRAISEVSSALASQAESGFSSVISDTSTSASASSGFGVNNLGIAAASAAAGAGTGGTIGGVVGGGAGVVIGAIAGSSGYGVGAVPGAIIGGVAGALGGSIVGGAVGGTAGFLAVAEFGSTQNNSSSNRLSNVTASSTVGSRSLTAAMAQNITDNTQQLASTVRNRRASVVQEIAQSETTDIKTRVVANYNHMHALTVQYFEVLQINQVRTSLTGAERCLYVPFAPIDPWSNEVIEKYLPYLLNAALNVDIVFGLLFDQGTTVMQSGAISSFTSAYIEEENLRRSDDMASVNAEFDDEVASRYLDPWIFREPLRIASLAVYGIDNHGSTMHHERVEFKVSLVDGRSQLEPGWLLNQESLASLPDIEDIRHISLILKAKEAALVPTGPVSVSLQFAAVDAPNLHIAVHALTIPDLAPFTEGLTVTIPIANFFKTPPKEWINKHLGLNGEYYTRHILGSLDEVELADILSRYQYNDTALLSLVEGGPIAFSGSHLVFKYPFKSLPATDGARAVSADNLRRNWLEDQGFSLDSDGTLQRETVAVDSVPMPTGGIFAEAVQGRANSAEKIDLTRFWDWKSSPIGKNAPEINSIKEVNRAVDLNPRAGVLQSGMINIQNGATLPTPEGQKALIATLGTPNLFRNLAGLEESSKLAKDALKLAADSAVTTGVQSAANLAKGLDATSKVISKVLTVAGDLGSSIAKAGFSVAGGAIPSGSDQSSSVIGGLLNAGKSLDDRRSNKSSSPSEGGEASPDSGGNSTPDVSPPAGGGSPGSSGPPGGAGSTPSIQPDGSTNVARFDGGPPPNAGNFSFEERAFNEVVDGINGFRDIDGSGADPLDGGFGAAEVEPQLREPPPRPCCAIGPGGVNILGLGIGYTKSIDPSDVAGHKYGSGGSATALFPKDAVGQVYTSRGGFVDLGHVRDLADMTHYLARNAIEFQAVGGQVGIASEAGQRTVVFKPYSAAPNGELAAMIAARASYQFAIWHEIVTWFTNIQYSAFSPEDNYSNLLGCYLGARATLSPGGNYNDSMDRVLIEVLSQLDAVTSAETAKATEAIGGLWYDHRIDLTNPIAIGGITGTPTLPDYLFRRHIVPEPVVTPWLVTDLHGQTFTIPDPVAGPGIDKTVDFNLGSPNPTASPLPVPTSTSNGILLRDFYDVIIDVDTNIVPQTFLPGQTNRITGNDLAAVTARVKADILSQHPGSDTPI